MRQTIMTGDAALVGAAGASAVILGAFGAHSLSGVLNPHQVEWWRTAVQYHFWHALALSAAVLSGRTRPARIAATSFAVGIVLFSGSLYALALGAPRWCGIITPLGGVAFIVGWLALGLGLRQRG